MTKVRNVARGVISNWASLAASILVGFFLSPFVVHHLGNTAYGIWALVMSLTSFMSLLDLGMRSTVMLLVSRNYALAQHEEASKAVSAALFVRAAIGLVIISFSTVLAFAAPRLFHIPPEMYVAARWAIFIAGVNLAVTLIFGVFGGVLAALHRFDLLSGVSVTQMAMRAAGAVWLLRHGHGIVALARWELFAVLTGNSVLTRLCFHYY
ncbi:MAG TPA: MATE family efflux transporter, partial [Candidatus Acidoferrum sp.]|nr:MATE family efflux transporter [Candidatus Acidoferrum sp.]